MKSSNLEGKMTKDGDPTLNSKGMVLQNQDLILIQEIHRITPAYIKSLYGFTTKRIKHVIRLEEH